MEGQEEKVYVAIGNDLQDGFGALEWALRKWSSRPISIVIIHANNNLSKDFVYGPYGKLPASSVNEEILEVLRKDEQEQIDKLLSKYISFCGEVKAEILKAEKYDEPIHKHIIDLISKLRITKLVVGITFMKSSSGKSKNAISGSFYVHRNRPDFCELFIICGGKLVFLREQDDEGFMEDDKGAMVGKLKEKASFRGRLRKMFTDNSSNFPTQGRSPGSPSAKEGSPNAQYQWENCVDEIEDYYQQLLSSNSDEKDCEEIVVVSPFSPTEPNTPACIDSDTTVPEKIETLRNKIHEAHETVQLKRKRGQG
ncbi:hypothetical protein L1049_025109 [Liquidambar formosana]|uniref:UspA domain-containing protein n=1 Tax=Liquidambar formosana TaxID=63359 RepID=A0AAP0X5B4_LIQFO